MPGSQAGNGVSCGGSRLDWEGCNVLGMSELFKKILKNRNTVELLAVKDSKAEDLLCYTVEKIVVRSLCIKFLKNTTFSFQKYSEEKYIYFTLVVHFLQQWDRQPRRKDTSWESVWNMTVQNTDATSYFYSGVPQLEEFVNSPSTMIWSLLGAWIQPNATLGWPWIPRHQMSWQSCCGGLHVPRGAAFSPNNTLFFDLLSWWREYGKEDTISSVRIRTVEEKLIWR